MDRFRVVLGAFVLLLVSTVVSAQTSSVSGRVTDAQGGFMANAEITLRPLPAPGAAASPAMRGMPGMATPERTTRSGVGPRLACGQQRVDGRIDSGRHAAQHAPHLPRVGPRVRDPLVRAAQLRCGDHLHRLGDLLRVLDRADPTPEID